MKVTWQKVGYELKVGDRIAVIIGVKTLIRIDTVTRLSKTQAICEKPNQQPVRYPRVYDMGFQPRPYQRSNIDYRVIKNEIA